MSRRRFSHLLEKYQRGVCTPVEKKFVEYWFGLIEKTPSEDDAEINWNELEAKMWANMQTSMHADHPETHTNAIFTFSALRWLSAASLILFASYLLFNHSVIDHWFGKVSNHGSDWIVKTNVSGKPEKIHLIDGSVVTLWPGSSVKFRDRFVRSEREVRLTGKAFFSIKRDTARPFYVKSGQITTKVLGTSFYVEEGMSAKFPTVEVVTGTVAVYETPKPGNSRVDNILLRANQQATFFSGQHKFVSGLVDHPHLIDPDMDQDRFRFHNIPLQQVLTTLGTAYGIEIVIENRDMQTCTLTANLTGQPLYTQLEIICAAVGGSFKVNNTMILVNGSGCARHHR